MLPYLAGERTPNLPDSTGGLLGLTLHNATPAHLARAAVEGMLCGLADALDALSAQGKQVESVRLVGGAASSPAVSQIAATVFGVPVLVPPPGEYVADGAARQAAWTLTGALPVWLLDGAVTRVEPRAELGRAGVEVRARYAEACTHWLPTPR
jgi:xylulokinase